ncbi:MAG: TolC family protein [Prevotellaceae bacterium]|jgi:outer membrane protein TolC|nr:TolC family protein [Prevotellaceae bacterium]
MKNKYGITILVSLLLTTHCWAQVSLSLENVITLGQIYSIDAQTYRIDSINFEVDKALFRQMYIPKMSLGVSAPSFSRGISIVTQPDGSDKFVERTNAQSSARMSLDQVVPFTGGVLSLGYSLSRIDAFHPSRYTSYSSSWISASYSQPFSRYNKYRWQKRIYEVENEQRRITLVQDIEKINLNSVSLFFELLIAQKYHELTIARIQNAQQIRDNCQILYQRQQILKEQLIEAEVNYMTSQEALLSSEQNMIEKSSKLKEFIGLNDSINVIFNDSMLLLMLKNNYVQKEIVLSRVLKYNNDIQEALTVVKHEDRIAQAKSTSGISASASLSLGLNSQAEELSNLYHIPTEQDLIGINLSIPILSWTENRLKNKKNQLQMERDILNIQKQRSNLYLKVELDIRRFAGMYEELENAKNKRNLTDLQLGITNQLFLEGRIDVEKMRRAEQNVMSANIEYYRKMIKTYQLIYEYRILALHDILESISLYEESMLP